MTSPPDEAGRPFGTGAEWLERAGSRPSAGEGDRLVIVGAGGHGRDVLDAAECDGRYEILGLVDDGRPDMAPLDRRRATFLGRVETLATLDARYVIAIGSPAARRRLDDRISAWGREPGMVVHPSATFGADVIVHPGLVVLAGARVTNHIWAGRHVHLNLNATVAHDAVLGDYVTLNPGANINGNVILEDGVTVGSNASVNHGLRIGSGTTIGAGAVAVRDLPGDVIAVGVPALPRTNPPRPTH